MSLKKDETCIVDAIASGNLHTLKKNTYYFSSMVIRNEKLRQLKDNIIKL